MSSSQNPMGMISNAKEKVENSLGSINQTVPEENLEIHTMKSELEAAKSGGLQQKSLGIARREKEYIPFEAKGNPFFSESQEAATGKNPAMVANRQESKPEAAVDKKVAIHPAASQAVIVEESEPSRIKWIIGPVLLVILALIGGGYYFWNANLKQSETADDSLLMTDPTAQSLTDNGDSQAQTATPVALSQDSPNYLTLGSSDDANAVLEEYSEKVVSGGFSLPVEFVPADENNAPIPLDTFLSRTGLVIPTVIRATLGSDYGLYVYSDAGKSRLGLSISCQDTTKASQELSKEEPSLVKYFRPLYLGLNIPAVGSFSSSSYAGTAIRYVNLTQGNEFSLDYAISSGNLLIGTSKDTLRAIIDARK